MKETISWGIYELHSLTLNNYFNLQIVIKFNFCYVVKSWNFLINRTASVLEFFFCLVGFVNLKILVIDLHLLIED